jgi:hypothetical protein
MKMPYITNCTCDDHQLNLIGCDCDHNGPARIVKTFADLEAEAAEAFFAAEIEREQAEIAYFEEKREKDLAALNFDDAPENFAEWALQAAKHQ